MSSPRINATQVRPPATVTLPLFWWLGQRLDCPAELLDRPRFDEEPRLAVEDRFGNASPTCRDDRDATAHRIEVHQRKRVIPHRWRDDHVDAAEELAIGVPVTRGVQLDTGPPQLVDERGSLLGALLPREPAESERLERQIRPPS